MELHTPVGFVNVPPSRAEGVQKAMFEKSLGLNNRFVVKVEWGDAPQNGYKSLSVTAEHYEAGRLQACGCLHDEIVQHFPQLEQAVRFHLCSTRGPLHYFPNTLYLAGDQDCWGYRRGEQRRSAKTLELCWLVPDSTRAGLNVLQLSNEKPSPDATPVLMEGKDRDLEAARRQAIWPEASDAVLSLPRNELEAALAGRLPALLTQFKKVIESLGFVY